MDQKYDAGKPDTRILGLFGKALWKVAEVGTKGNQKYDEDSWHTVPDGYRRYTSAMLRHFLLEAYEERDEELAIPHQCMVAWNALARLELMLRDAEARKEEKAPDIHTPNVVVGYTAEQASTPKECVSKGPTGHFGRIHRTGERAGHHGPESLEYIIM